MILDNEENEKDSDFLSTIKAGTYIPFSSYSGCWIVSCQQMLSKIYQYLESSKKPIHCYFFIQTIKDLVIHAGYISGNIAEKVYEPLYRLMS